MYIDLQVPDDVSKHFEQKGWKQEGSGSQSHPYPHLVRTPASSPSYIPAPIRGSACDLVDPQPGSTQVLDGDTVQPQPLNCVSAHTHVHTMYTHSVHVHMRTCRWMSELTAECPLLPCPPCLTVLRWGPTGLDLPLLLGWLTSKLSGSVCLPPPIGVTGIRSCACLVLVHWGLKPSLTCVQSKSSEPLNHFLRPLTFVLDQMGTLVFDYLLEGRIMPIINRAFGIVRQEDC